MIFGTLSVLFTIFSCSREGKIHWTPEMHPIFSYLALDTFGTGVSASFVKEGFWGPGRWGNCGGPLEGRKSGSQLYSCSTGCLCLSLYQGPVASGVIFSLDAHFPCCLMPFCLCPLPKVTYHLQTQISQIPGPEYFHAACQCPTITVKGPRTPVMVCLSSVEVVTIFYVIARCMLLSLGLYSLKK